MFKYLLKFIKFAGKQRKHMIIALVFGLLQSIFTAFSLLATAYALQNMIEGTATMSTVWSAFGIVGGGVLLAAVCNYFSTQFLTYAGYTIAANARIRIADKLKYAPMGYFNEHNLGQIANTATNTAESLQDTLTRCLLLTTKGLFMALVITISLLVFDWRIGLVAAAGFVLFLIINHFLHKAGEKNSDRKTVSGDKAVEAVLEYVQGIAVIKSYNLTGKANKKVTSAIKEDRDVNYALEKNYIPFMALQGVAVKLAGVAIIAVSVWLYTQLSMPLFTALVACIASFMVFNDLDSGGNMSALLRMAANSIDKIEAAMNLPVMDINGKEITPAKTDIAVQNVDFSYDKRKIIDGVTVDIPARSSLAIVGGSGSGKTTLCNLILRFWDVDKGSISLGGHDVREYKLDSLLKNYSMVFQNVYLFNDTIANNIRFGKPDASMEEVIEAAKKACCHDFISALPDGYDTVIGEGGASISGGEKQRISIARMILKNAPIVILDEATAFTDQENEEKIQQSIAALTKGKTLLVIAHRLSTIKNADQIIVLQNGQVENTGTHQQLLAGDALYRDMWEAHIGAQNWSAGSGKGGN